MPCCSNISRENSVQLGLIELVLQLIHLALALGLDAVGVALAPLQLDLSLLETNEPTFAPSVDRIERGTK